jgi:acid stress-induced BolA-like protein IbaG/YrbA
MVSTFKSLIEQALPGARVELFTEDNVHYSVFVVAEQFQGQSTLKQQQLVYQALGDYLTSGVIHALTMKTYTPEAWTALKNKG